MQILFPSINYAWHQFQLAWPAISLQRRCPLHHPRPPSPCLRPHSHPTHTHTHTHTHTPRNLVKRQKGKLVAVSGSSCYRRHAVRESVHSNQYPPFFSFFPLFSLLVSILCNNRFITGAHWPTSKAFGFSKMFQTANIRELTKCFFLFCSGY